MKRILLPVLALLFTVMTIAPTKSSAREANVADVIVAGALIALVAIEIDQMVRCGQGELRYCDYYEPQTRCHYQEVRTDSVRTECRQRGYWSGYQCVTESRSTSTFIRSCGRPFQYRL